MVFHPNVCFKDSENPNLAPSIHLPRVTFFKLELCEEEMHFQLSLSPKWVQSRVQWAVGGSAKCKQTFDQLLSSFARFPRDLDPLWTVEKLLAIARQA